MSREADGSVSIYEIETGELIAEYDGPDVEFMAQINHEMLDMLRNISTSHLVSNCPVCGAPVGLELHFSIKSHNEDCPLLSLIKKASSGPQ